MLQTGTEATRSAKPVVEPLDAETTQLLVSFARACKGAARAVSLYPPEHPAIQSTLARLVEVSAAATANGTLYVAVVPENLLIDGHPPARRDIAIAELASILHQHMVGEIIVQAGADADAWQKFLRVMATSPADIQTDGGLSHALAAAACHHIEVREIDYAEVLRERDSGEEASWERIIANCLSGDQVELDEETLASLLQIASDAKRLSDFAMRLEERAGPRGAVRAQTAALIRVFRSIAGYVARVQPEKLDSVLGNMATAACRLSPEVMLELLSQRRKPGGEVEGIDVVDEVISRIGDPMVASFVARSVVTEHGATVRLAEAFQALVPDVARRQSVMEMVRNAVAGSVMGQDRNFERLWARVEEMLTSYSDKQYVSEAYNRELAGARLQALEIERVTDDPPERIAGWLTTVSDAAVRTLDLSLLLDLLEVEPDPFHWREVTNIVVPHIEDLVLVGDFDAARQLVAELSRAAKDSDRAVRRQAAAAAVERLVDGDLLDNVATHLQTLSDVDFEPVKDLCRAMGPTLIDPLAELIALEQRVRVRQRLTELLLAFGAAGRQSVEQLMTSPNPSVRRTAVLLLRDFGGSDAIPELRQLLADQEPHVQREAVRALLLIGTGEAYSVLERALSAGGGGSSGLIMREISALGDQRAAPLFCYILGNTEPRGKALDIYQKAIERLGVLGGTAGVEALKAVLYRGDWWAPIRTAALRRAAAAALRKIDSDEARAVLEEASSHGPRGVRAAVRAA